MAKVLLQYNDKRFHKIGFFFTLSPGVNEVDAKAWADAEKIAGVRYLLKQGTIEVIKAGVGEASLKSVKPATAAKLVADTYDVALLDRWLGEETRPNITEAIKDQLKLIKDAGDKPREAAQPDEV